MKIYVSEAVYSKQDDYVNFLVGISGYNRREAEIRRWEIDYQIKRRCTPILMKPSTSGTLSFKTVLQQQEIRRIGENYPELIKIINRRRGNRGNTQWKINYLVSTNGDVFVTSIECHNTFSGTIKEIANDRNIIILTESQLKNIIKESIKKILFV